MSHEISESITMAYHTSMVLVESFEFSTHTDSRMRLNDGRVIPAFIGQQFVGGSNHFLVTECKPFVLLC
jgi:hypothetical protein